MDDLVTPPRAAGIRRALRASVLAMLVCAPAIASAQRSELERQVQRTTLPNGLDVIVVENRGVPLVTIEADVKNGSFTQDREFEGLSHLVGDGLRKQIDRTGAHVKEWLRN